MVNGLTERSHKPRACVRVDLLYRALRRSALKGTQLTRGTGGKSVYRRGPTYATEPVKPLHPVGSKRLFSLEKLIKSNIGLENTKYGGGWRVEGE